MGGIIGFVLSLVVVYKIFSSTSPNAMPETQQDQREQMENIPRSVHPNMENMNSKRNRFDRGDVPIFGGRVNGRLERGPFDRNKFNKNMRNDRRVPKFGDGGIPNMEKMKNMLNKGAYSDMGEGPIFNGLNDQNPKTKLSPFEVKQKLKAARERHQGGRHNPIERREEM